MNSDCGWPESITWTHRSVPEFLETRSFQDGLLQYAQSSDPIEAISHLVLAQIGGSNPQKMTGTMLGHLCYHVMLMRMIHRNDHIPFAYLESLGSAAGRIAAFLHKAHEGRPDPPFKDIALHPYQTVGCQVATMRGNIQKTSRPFHIASYLGMSEYVEWKMNQKNFDFVKEASVAVHLSLCA